MGWIFLGLVVAWPLLYMVRLVKPVQLICAALEEERNEH